MIIAIYICYSTGILTFHLYIHTNNRFTGCIRDLPFDIQILRKTGHCEKKQENPNKKMFHKIIVI